ncbi:TIGR03089 family protein [Cellulomonas sp. DKR-3]|uniref:TIGR03089 family protein n=1 Tax=Cellulomonas fulva TaxID=2835530 RepID=A0ABS5TZN5_9CELL|nr:TIGR03089 family protein [Cellulomonas fulva]
MRALLREPGRPRVTWYGDEGERVELSGAVLENWVNKTTNLLVEELDAGPGTVVALDLPAHWRTVPWTLAALRAGATLALGPSTDADVVVTAAPDDATVPAGAQLVVVTLPALARRAAGPLPAHALDAAASVMTYGDALGWVAPADPASAALVGPLVGADLDADPGSGAQHVPHVPHVQHGALGSWWAGLPSDRLLLAPDGAAVWLRRVLGTLAADGSLVLLSAGRADELGRDGAALDRLVASERITASTGLPGRLPGPVT